MNPKNEWFKLSKESTLFLFIYYLLLLLAGIFFLINQLSSQTFIKTIDIFEKSLWISINSSILGATVFYIRKLYKSCINQDVVSPVSNEDKIRQIGVFFYFFLRPIFSVVFSIIVLVVIKAGISILSSSKLLTADFFYFTIIISFFVGYSSGDLVDKFEEVGKKIIDKVSDVKL